MGLFVAPLHPRRLSMGGIVHFEPVSRLICYPHPSRKPHAAGVRQRVPPFPRLGVRARNRGPTRFGRIKRAACREWYFVTGSMESLGSGSPSPAAAEAGEGGTKSVRAGSAGPFALRNRSENHVSTNGEPLRGEGPENLVARRFASGSVLLCLPFHRGGGRGRGMGVTNLSGAESRR